MTNAAVADPPKTGTDTGAADGVDAIGKGDTGADLKVGTDSQVQTGAKPEDVTKAAAADADPAKADDKADPDPIAAPLTASERLRLQELEANFEAAVKSGVDTTVKQTVQETTTANREKERSARKQAITTHKGEFTRSLSTTTAALAALGVDEEKIDEALNPIRAWNLKHGNLLGGLQTDFSDALDEAEKRVLGAIKAVVPEADFADFETKHQDATDLDTYFKGAVEFAVSRMSGADFFKANPAARASVLTIEQIDSLVPEDKRAQFDKAVGDSKSVVKHLEELRELDVDRGLNTNRGQPGARANGAAAADNRTADQKLTDPHTDPKELAEMLAKAGAR